MNKQQLISALPSRSTVDELVAEYFDNVSVGSGTSFLRIQKAYMLILPVIIHKPSFLREVS
jgi:hypothetical protein